MRVDQFCLEPLSFDDDSRNGKGSEVFETIEIVSWRKSKMHR